MTSLADPGPMVSIVIPCYNHGKYLGQAIESILSETFYPVEIIVVNDGSTDNTEQVAHAFEGRIRYIYKDNAGLSAARNSGILYARGEFVLFLDADDYLLPDALTRFMDAVRSEPAGDVYFGNWEVVDEAGNVLRTAVPEVIEGEDMLHRYLRGNVFPCHAAVVRKAALANSNLFDTQLQSFEDWDIWLRLAVARARFVAVAAATVAYRQHTGSMSRHYDRMRTAGTAVLSKSGLSHQNCEHCRRAKREGFHTMRFYLYVNLLEPELKSLLAEREIMPLVRRFAQVCTNDPRVGVLVLRLALNKIRSRFRNDSSSLK